MTNLVETIENKLEEFGLTNINEKTTVFVNKSDLTDVSVEDTDFNTFTKAHACPARWLVTHFTDCNDEPYLRTSEIQRFVDEIE